MQMTVTLEGLPLNSKHIKIRLEEGVLVKFSSQPPLVIVSVPCGLII